MVNERVRSSESTEQAAGLPRHISLGMQLAAMAAFLLWRSYYFITVVVIPAMGWR
jgi:hypothetical protein